MKNKIITLIIVIFSLNTIHAEENAVAANQGKASAEGINSASKFAWVSFGVSFVVVVGIIVAIGVNKYNK